MPTKPRKPAAKKAAPKKSTQAGPVQGPGMQEKLITASKGKRQFWAVVLFGIAALIFCITVFNGRGANGETNFWSWLHDMLLGLFGICSILWPILLFYIAIMLSMDKPIGKISTKIYEIAFLIILIDSAINIFTDQKVFSDLWESGKSFASGGVCGWPLAWFLFNFGSPGAHIIVCILIFVVLMLITSTGLIELFSFITKPVRKSYEHAGSGYDERASKKRGDGIDVSIEDDPILNPDGVFTRKTTQKDVEEKKEKLEQVFSDDDVPQIKIDIVKPAKKEEIKQITIEDIKPQPVRERKYPYPPLSLLDDVPNVSETDMFDEQNSTAKLLVKTLASFNVDVKVLGISRGPSVTRYELQPNVGVRINKIKSLADDIALCLATKGVRIEAPIPGKAAVGIEVPNKKVTMVKIKEILDSNAFATSKSKLTVALGKDIEGNLAVTDLSKMPHLLVAGTTGSGKSVSINSMILSLLYKSTAEEVKLLLIDPKKVEFIKYDGIPHLLVPVVTDSRKAAGALAWAVQEMLKRYNIFAENKVRDLESYNNLATGKKNDDITPLPRIVIFIDEFADLMMECPTEVEDSVIRLAQMARAAGMHLVIATQRPAADVITGLIRSNIPSRLALSVKYESESRIILGSQGAEKLLGYGDMLFEPIGSKMALRIQGCYVSDNEVESVVDFLSKLDSQYDEDIMEEIERQAAAEKNAKGSKGDNDNSKMDDMLIAAVDWVLDAGQASTSMLQRRLSVGYARAGRMIDEMEQRGIIGPSEGSKPRQVLLTRQQWLEMKNNLSD